MEMTRFTLRPDVRSPPKPAVAGARASGRFGRASRPQRVTLPQGVQSAGEARPFGDAAAAGVVVDALAPGARQRVTLEYQVLLRRRHPHVSDQHRPPRSAQTREGQVFWTKESS